MTFLEATPVLATNTGSLKAPNCLVILSPPPTLVIIPNDLEIGGFRFLEDISRLKKREKNEKSTGNN